MQVFSLPALGVAVQILLRPAPIGQVQDLASSIFRRCDSERDAIDLDGSVIEANLTWLQFFEGGPDRESR